MDPFGNDPLAAAILLGATAAGDADVALAPLAPALRARVQAAIRAAEALRAQGREAAMAALIAATTPAISVGLGAAPARARAVVASLVPREQGSAWLREAGAPRKGFRASAALRTTLLCTDGDAWRA